MTGKLQFPVNSSTLSFGAPTTLSSNTSFVLPNSNGTTNQVLSTDGKGNTSWVNTALPTSSYLITAADSNLPNAIVLPLTNTGVYSSTIPGSGNLYIGTNAGNNNVAPTSNLAIGYKALTKISDISSVLNTAIGAGAGSTQTQYKNCTFIGANADANANQLTNATAIGANTIVSKNYAYVIGSEKTNYPVGIGVSSPNYSLHICNTTNDGYSNYSCGILLANTAAIPPTPIGEEDIVLYAAKGNDYGALYFKNSNGNIYKFISNRQAEPAADPLIPVLTSDQIQALTEIALGAIVYDSTNDTVIISTRSGWQNLTRSPYNPQSLSTGI